MVGLDGGDRFRQARGLLIVLWGLMAIVAALGVAGSAARARLVDDPRPGLVQALGLEALTLTPAGRPPRPPDPPPAVDLRFVPGVSASGVARGGSM